MAPRKKPPKPDARAADAFAETYDAFLMMYGNPVEYLFRTMANPEEDPSERRLAAAELMSYRFPKLKTLENIGDMTQPVLINIRLDSPRDVQQIGQVIDIKGLLGT